MIFTGEPILVPGWWQEDADRVADNANPRQALPFHWQLLLTVAAIAVLPVVVVAGFLVMRGIETAHRELGSRVTAMARISAVQLEMSLDLHREIVLSAAQTLNQGGWDAAKAQQALEVYKGSHSGILGMLAADSTGLVVAAEPAVDDRGQAIVGSGHRVDAGSDLAQVLQTPSPYFSGVGGRGFANDPVVVISAPLRSAQGKVNGVLEASLDLKAFERLSTLSVSGLGGGVLILDPSLRMAYTSSPQLFSTQEPLSGSAALSELFRLAEGVVIETAIDPRLGTEHLVTRAMTSQGWTLLAFVDVAERRRELTWVALGAAALIGVVALVSLVVAWAAARRMAGPVQRLSEAVREFRPEAPIMPETPASVPREIGSLYHEFRNLGRRLATSYADLNTSLAQGRALREALQDALGQRERTIRERTEMLEQRGAELERANTRLQRLASEDGLTGIANRRALDEFLALALRRSHEDGSRVVLVMIDVDHFKSYNDLAGHQAGDDALRQIAQALRPFGEGPDSLVARYGGEELACIWCGLTLAVALDLAEQIRLTVESLGIIHPGLGPGQVLGCSLGVAEASAAGVDTPDGLISAADRALYTAKRSGRNRVRAASAIG